MPRRLLSLLALLLLLVAAQAAAGGGKDGKHGHGGGDDDRDDDWREDDDDRKDGGKEGKKDKGGNGKEGKPHRRGKGGSMHDGEAAAPAPAAPSIGAAAPRGVPDAGLQVLATALPGRVQFSFLVTAAASFDRVTLAGDLPDVAGDWAVSGPGAAACSMAGTRLACAFEGLVAGEVQLVQTSAPVGHTSPWELVAGATVDAGRGADARPGNDAATAGLGLLLR